MQLELWNHIAVVNSEVFQMPQNMCMCVFLCSARCGPVDYSLPGSSLHFPGKNTEVGCHFLLQGIFPTQRSNPRLLLLLHWLGGFFTTSTTWEARYVHILA